MSSFKITGLNNVMNNLNKRINQIEGRTLKGLIRAAIIIRRDMDKTAPLIPVDIGNLRASFFVVTSDGNTPYGSTPKFRATAGNRKYKGDLAKLQSVHSSTVMEMQAKAKVLGIGKGPFVVFGFGAYYAIYVHEMVGVSGMSQRALGSMKSVSKRGQSSVGWTRPGSGPKFLENAVDRNTALVLYTVAKEAKKAL
jgi:hypothetical protein